MNDHRGDANAIDVRKRAGFGVVIVRVFKAKRRRDEMVVELSNVVDVAQARGVIEIGIQFFLDPSASGSAYIFLSGGGTISSGGFFLSGGFSDGMKVPPGGSYFIPKMACGVSGQLGIWTQCDPACSGQARLYFEVF